MATYFSDEENVRKPGQDAGTAECPDIPTYESPNHFGGWEEMLADLDRVTDNIKACVSEAIVMAKGNQPAGILRAVPDQVDRIRYELRHVVNYARDCEAGNAELRRQYLLRPEERHRDGT